MLTMLSAVPAFAAHQVSTPAELVSAVTAINNGDADNEIVMAPGTYDLSTVTPMNETGIVYMVKAMHIRGSDDTSWRTTDNRETKTVIDAKGLNSAFSFNLADSKASGCWFRHLTIKNGNGKGHGGGAIRNGWYCNKYFSCTNCVFVNNAMTGQAGALHTASAYDCRFGGNTAMEGGAILQAQYVRNCLFERNKTTSNGGAIRNVSYRIYDSTFLCNTNTGGNGSCVYSNGNSLENCLCISNYSSSGGCALPENKEKTTTAINCGFYYNYNASGSMSAAALTHPILVTNCVFVGNSANEGTVINCTSNRQEIVDCVFSNNFNTGTSHAYGGAVIYGGGRATAPTVRRCGFYGNSATGNGGAVRYAKLYDCTFTENESRQGGGAAADSDAYSCTFVSNRCGIANNYAYGAAILGTSGEANYVHVSNSTIRANHSLGCAGGVAYAVLEDSTVEGNVAETSIGGCYYVNGARNLIADNVSTNTAIKSDPTAGTESCKFDRCRLIGNLSRKYALTNSSFTNCLVTGNMADANCFYSCKFYNCTVVSNGYERGGQTIANGMTAVNTIFLNNSYNYARGSGSNNWTTYFDWCGYGQCYMTNCVMKRHAGWTAYTLHDANTITGVGTGFFLEPTDPEFDPENPYKLARKSPARDYGIVEPWMTGAVDLLGNDRIYRKTKVELPDLGCYESQWGWVGLIITFK